MNSIDKRFFQNTLIYLFAFLGWFAASVLILRAMLPALFNGSFLFTFMLDVLVYTPYFIGSGIILHRMSKQPVSVGVLLTIPAAFFIVLFGNWFFRSHIDGSTVSFEVVLAYLVGFFNLIPLLWKAGQSRRELMAELLINRVKLLPVHVTPFFLHEEKMIGWPKHQVLLMPVLFERGQGWDVRFFVLIGDDAYEWTFIRENLFIAQNTSIDGAIAEHLRKVIPHYWFPDPYLNDKIFWERCVLEIHGNQFAYIHPLPNIR